MDRRSAWAAVLALAGVAAGGTPEVHVRGVVEAITGDAITVKTVEGKTEKLALGPKTRVTVVTQADASAIAQGGYVGTTAVPAGEDTLRALEVHVFPDSMRGAGEGHRPWDRPGSTMTNATVASTGSAGDDGGSTMTNASVSGVKSNSEGQQLTLTYSGGKQTVLVPTGTPIVKLAPADRSALAVGEHVFVAGPRQADGTVEADRMAVGKGGVVPPM